MYIKGIGAALPSRSVSNHEVLKLVALHSEPVFDGSVEDLLERIDHLLAISGGSHRRWSDPDNPEDRPLALIKRAVTIAAEDAEVSLEEIDLLIYCGVGKGCLEPGQSYFVAQSLGMTKTHCFDVLDACMSWARALQLAYHLLSAGTYRNVAIVNGEVSDYPGGPLFPQNLKVRSMEELAWLFPSYTIGSAATCTIVSGDRPETFDRWSWKFESKTDMADYCVIGAHRLEHFAEPSPRTEHCSPFAFSAFGKEQHDAAREVFFRWVANQEIDFKGVKYIYPHAASKRAWDEWHHVIPEETSFYHVYPRTGNIVSASIPTGIYLSKKEGLLKRGDRIAGLMVSAGMSFATFQFEF